MIEIQWGLVPSEESVMTLYKANNWSAADKPEQLMQALGNSHGLATAWEGEALLGLGNAISDGHLVVYFPHLLVHPKAHGKGVGKKLMHALMDRYAGFHMQMLTADGDSVGFYEKMGFEQAGKTVPMWIYGGGEH